MSNIDLIKLLGKAIFHTKGTRIQRLMKAPRKMLYSKLLEFMVLLCGRPIKVKAKTFWGDDMFVVIPEGVSLKIYRYGLIEEELTRIILKYLKCGMTFFDIGAHFGYYTLLGSFIVGNKGQVHTFEPTPSTFSILNTNVSNKDNVILNNCAIYSNRQTILINDFGLRYSAFNSIYSERLPQEISSKLKVKKYEVDGVSIDNYVEEQYVKPDFVKIDAEKSEYEILLGMEKTIAKFHPIISIEVGDTGVTGIPRSKDLINLFVNKGYQPYELKNGKIEQHAVKNDKYQYDNILFLPRR